MIKVSFIDWIGLSGKQIVLLGSKVCYKIKHKIKITIQLYPYDSYWFIGWMKWVFCCIHEHIHIYTLEFWKAPFRHLSEFGVSIKISICRIAVESHQISPLHWDWNWSNRKMERQQTASVDLNSSKRFKSPTFISIFQYFHCKIVAIVGY